MLSDTEMVSICTASLGLLMVVTGQASGGLESHGGPDHHNVEAIRSDAATPRLARSAGF